MHDSSCNRENWEAFLMYDISLTFLCMWKFVKIEDFNEWNIYNFQRKMIMQLKSWSLWVSLGKANFKTGRVQILAVGMALTAETHEWFPCKVTFDWFCFLYVVSFINIYFLEGI